MVSWPYKRGDYPSPFVHVNIHHLQHQLNNAEAGKGPQPTWVV